MEKYQYFNGLKFTRDEKSGYYLNSTIRKRIHRYVWEFYNGEIPIGFHIHHIDHNKSNNDITNLELISSSKHIKYHSDLKVKNNYDEMVKILNEKARPKANEWHGSKEGLEFHSKLGKENWKKRKPIKKICAQCGSEFDCITLTKTNIFCSNKCKSAWRRDSGVDNEIRNCQHCNNEFEVNKYSKTKCCSRNCSKKQYWSTRSI